MPTWIETTIYGEDINTTIYETFTIEDEIFLDYLECEFNTIDRDNEERINKQL